MGFVGGEQYSLSGADVLCFLADEIVPYVDRIYRTIPGDRGLLGHSNGGLFALYALAQHAAFFQRIVAASPVGERTHRWIFAAAN
ncbi:MAG TPA: alpha/beta hydrolase-fold protein [Candidatus Didemnitutus sp.]